MIINVLHLFCGDLDSAVPHEMYHVAGAMKACPKFMIKSASSRDKSTGPRNFFCLAVCGGWLWSRRSPLGLTDHTPRMPSFRGEMYTLKGQQSSFDSGAYSFVYRSAIFGPLLPPPLRTLSP